MASEIRVKSVLNKHKKRDYLFLDDYSVNPYLGCSFNCIYCYIRGSKYGKNTAKTFAVKMNAPEVLEEQLSRRAKKGEYGFIALSSSTDPYVPIEEKLKLTRKLLGIILKYKFPVEVITKSNLVLRDLDLLKEIDQSAILPNDLGSELKHGVIISFSLSTLDWKLAKILEPGAPAPDERLKAMKRCKEEGFLVGVSYIPLLPFLSDSENELDEMVKTAKEYGADFVLSGALTLFGGGPSDSKTLFYKFLKEYYPVLVSKYKQLFGASFQPPKEYQKKLDEKLKKLCEKYGIKDSII